MHVGSYFRFFGVREGDSLQRVGRRRVTFGDSKGCFFTVAAPCSIPMSNTAGFQFLHVLTDTHFLFADLLVLIITFLVGVNSTHSR